MKMIGVLAVAVLTVIGSFTARAQGPLNPSAPPGETMKTLDQIEPRMPIGSAPHTITHAGSYYLTTNLNGTLTIAVDNVTLDLMGFQISTTSGNAISQWGSRTNILVRNGILANLAGNGIDFSTSTPDANGVIEDLRVRGCGVFGLVVGDGFTVRRCHVSGTTLAGIRVYGNSRILDNTVTRCGTGLYLSSVNALVEGNVVKGNADNYNLVAGNQLNLLLCEIPETLDWPCSVKLAGTLTCSVTGTNGITVNANDVTIDMAGHTLIGPGAGSKSGIYQGSAYRNLHVFNGKATQWRGTSQAGFLLYGGSGILTDLQASSNYYGIIAGSGSALARCKASQNGEDGIYVLADCTLAQCAVYDNNDDGIYASYGCSLANCSTYGNGNFGIYASAICSLADCAAYFNMGYGICANYGCALANCTAYYNYDDGICANYGCTLANCAAFDNGTDGIDANTGCSLANCSAYNNGDDGIFVNYGCSLDNCAAYDNTDNGILAYEGCTLANCSASHNSSNGVYVAYENHVSGCTCESNGAEGNGAGIYASGFDNRIEGNTCTDNDRGIHVTGTGNFIVRNTCSGNDTNWVISANNKVGTIVNAPNSGAISGDTGGAGVGSTDPWANFTY